MNRVRLPRYLRGGLAFLLLYAAGVGAQLSVEDDEGRRIGLPEPARRVVSLAPHLTELVFAIGAGGRLVGADQRSDYPVSARDLPRIGQAGQLDLERIMALEPDLVLAWGSGNPAAQVESLRRLGLPVFASEPRSPLDIVSSIERIGVLLDAAERAATIGSGLRTRFQLLKQRYRGARTVRVFYQVWHQPLITFNGEHLVSQGLAVCGGVNVFEGLLGLAPRVSIEAVLEADPEVIVASGLAGERPAWLDRWRRWPDLAAVRSNQLHALHPDLAFRHTPRFFDGLEQLCEWVQGAREHRRSSPGD